MSFIVVFTRAMRQSLVRGGSQSLGARSSGMSRTHHISCTRDIAVNAVFLAVGLQLLALF